MSETASQKEVLDYHQEDSETDGAVTVGRYVRVIAADHNQLVCKGPKEDLKHGWEIVEINWATKSYLLAPREDVE